MTHGRLRIYLGVAPGAGTTHALLHEARRDEVDLREQDRQTTSAGASRG